MRKSRCSFPFASLAIVLAFGCGGTSSTPIADSSDPFVGNWSCTGMSSTTFTAPPNTAAIMASTAATVTITDDGMGALTIARMPADGGVPCTLHSHLSTDKKSTTLFAGQTCPTDNGDTLSYTMGTWTLTTTGASTSASWTLSGMTKAGAAVTGMGTASSTCTKT